MLYALSLLSAMWTLSITVLEVASVTPTASRTPSSPANSSSGFQMKRHKGKFPLCLESCGLCPGLFRLRLEPGFLDDPHPALVILADTIVESGRWATAGKHAVTFEVFLDGRVLQRLVDRAVEPVDDRLRGSTRRHRPEPEHDFIPGNRFIYGGNV